MCACQAGMRLMWKSKSLIVQSDFDKIIGIEDQIVLFKRLMRNVR